MKKLNELLNELDRNFSHGLRFVTDTVILKSLKQLLLLVSPLKSLQVKKLHAEAILPSRAHEWDAGLDLYALHSVFIPLGGTVKIATGIAINIPEGYYTQIQDRSGLASKGLRTGAGVVDHGYHGELLVVMHNLAYEGEDDGYHVKAGDRVAQMVVHKIELPVVEEVAFEAETERGTKGFGSSGA